MGCDFRWRGTATEEQQRLCGWFLESLFDADARGVSTYFPGFMSCETYNGDQSAFLYEVGLRQDLGPYQESVQLTGTTVHAGYFEDREPGSRLWATDQLSFVFMKSDKNLGDLVTVEAIPDISQPRYDLVREQFEYCKAKPDLPLIIFRRRGQDRLLANEGWLARLLYAIKRQFMPTLHVADDYGFFAGVDERDELDERFSYSILKPTLADKWGFQLDSAEPIISEIGASFKNDRIKNLGLSDAASAPLSQAKVFSLSDLNYITRNSFERIYKPTPAILQEIEEAMRIRGYLFQAEPSTS